MKKLFKVLENFPFYLEVFAKRLNGKCINEMDLNGEVFLINKIISTFSNKGGGDVIFDIGANKGLWCDELLKVSKNLHHVHLFDANKNLVNFLKSKYSEHSNINIEHAVFFSEIEKNLNFFIDQNNQNSGSNSIYKHYYLEKSIEVNLTSKTVDHYCEKNKIEDILLMKIDVEGAEIDILNGAKNMFLNQRIQFTQIEYNQTWIKSGKSLSDLFKLCEKSSLQIYRVCKNFLIPIPFYHYTLDDFNLQNLLLCNKKNLKKLNYKIHNRYNIIEN